MRNNKKNLINVLKRKFNILLVINLQISCMRFTDEMIRFWILQKKLLAALKKPMNKQQKILVMVLLAWILS
jgi:hypothetical protein